MAFELVVQGDARACFSTEFEKNGKHYVFTVPRMDFLPEDVYHAFYEWTRKNPDDKLLKAGKRPIEAAFDFLVGELKPEGYESLISELVFGEKQQLWEEWGRVSNISLGESQPSSTS